MEFSINTFWVELTGREFHNLGPVWVSPHKCQACAVPSNIERSIAGSSSSHAIRVAEFDKPLLVHVLNCVKMQLDWNEKKNSSHFIPS